MFSLWKTSVKHNRNRLKNWWSGSRVGKATRELSEEEIEGLLQPGKESEARKKAKGLLGVGVVLLVIVGVLVWAAGWVGTQTNLFGSGSGIWEDKDGVGSESQQDSGKTASLDKGMAENLETTSAEVAGKSNDTYYEHTKESLEEKGIYLEPAPKGQKYVVTPESRDVTKYMREKYGTPKEANFYILEEGGRSDGEIRDVAELYNAVKFQIQYGKGGEVVRDNFATTMVVEPGRDWKDWFKTEKGMEVAVTFPEGYVKAEWVEARIKGSLENQAFKANPQNFKIAVKDGKLSEEVLVDFLNYVKGENSGFSKPFSIVVNDSVFDVNIHGEPTLRK